MDFLQIFSDFGILNLHLCDLKESENNHDLIEDIMPGYTTTYIELAIDLVQGSSGPR